MSTSLPEPDGPAPDASTPLPAPVEEAFRGIVEDSPDGIFLYRVEESDEEAAAGAPRRAFRRVFMNRTARDLVSTDPDSLLGTSVREVPNGLLGPDLIHLLEALADQGGAQERVLEVEAGESFRAFRVRARRTGTLLALRLMEVTDRVRAERNAERREAILRGAARVGRRLLKHPWQDVLPDVLADLGQATHMSRVYLFVRRPESEDPPVFDQIEEWCAPGTRSQRDDPDLQGIVLRDRGLGAWETALLSGAHVHEVIPRAKAHIRNLFVPMDIKAILCVPVEVEGRLWGILGLDDCRRARGWSEGELDVLRSAAGLLAGAVERQETARQLAQSHARMAAAVSASEDAFLLVRPDGTVLEHNQAALRLFLPDHKATDTDPLTGKQLVEAFLPGLPASLPSGSFSTMRVDWEGRNQRGDTFPAQVQIAQVPQDGEPLLALSVRDLTHRKALEDQLWQTQKLDTVGRLAGGVAHDFNNLLTVIQGNVDLAHRALSDGDVPEEELDEAARAADRGARLTQQLLAFSRRQVLQPVPLDLNELVQDSAQLFASLIGDHIEVDLDLADGLDPVLADPSQLEQVVMNLVLNARDAMPRGGHLTVETTNVSLDEAYGERHMGAEPGDYVLLSVSDTGTGIAQEHLDRIFDPFFTTKAHGEGTGLGLSTVYGIVKQSRGDIWVYSEPGKGTMFKVYLPKAQSSPERPVPAASGPGDALKGREQVLVAEDDAAVRAVTGRVLAQLGYEVEVAASAEEALDVLRTGADFDLLLTDVVLPEMSGRDLAHRAQELRPELRVLFTSGYTVNAIVHQGMLDPGIQFVEKPFTPLTLGRAVRRTLDDPTGHTLPPRAS